MGDRRRTGRDRIAETYAAYDRDGSTERWNPEQPGNAAILRERERFVGRLLASRAPRRTLEIGCGRGDVLSSLPMDGDARIGIDLLGDRLRTVERAARRVALIEGDGAQLPIADGSIDLVVAFTVFSSVLDPSTRTLMADEINRVVRQDGALLWYDLRYGNARNRQITPITARELSRLFPGWNLDLSTTTVLPPLARRLGGATERIYPLLARLPLLRTHHIGLLTR